MNRLLFLLALLLVASLAASAQPSTLISFQGYAENGGSPVSGSLPVGVAFYDAPAGGALAYAETHQAVVFQNGVFALALGGGTPFGGNPVPWADLDFSVPYWLEVAIAGAVQTPRTPLRAVPYARTLAAPARIAGAASNSDAVTVTNTTTSGNYGDGLTVYGASVGSSRAVSGWTVAPGGVALFGSATSAAGVNYGVYGLTNSSSGRGVYGSGPTYGVEASATGTTGSTYGVVARSASPSGSGVYAVNLATSGTAAYGGHFESNSPVGLGVYGRGYNGIAGQGTFTGVTGQATGTSGSAAGVYGSGTYGVWGTGQSYGVYGNADGATGRGIAGRASANISTAYAVYGSTVYGAAYAGYFSGKVHVTGTLSKGGGSFEIDHPLDPEHRVLRHSFVESPDMMNVYNGNATTDRAGYATITLPDYFGALNRDFRYQLTTVGSFSRAMVAEEIEGNRFVIRTEEPGVRVSWQVTGIRQDAWANENRIVVEEDKRPDQRGRYLHPTAFGQPRERGVDYDATEEAQLDEGRRLRMETREQQEATHALHEQARERMHERMRAEQERRAAERQDAER